MTATERMRVLRYASPALLIVLGLAWAVTHVLGVFSESVNWDELALLHRAERTLVSGNMEAGGRPGLGVAALLPFVSGCTDTTSTIDTVRLVWAAVTAALLAGLFVFLLRAVRDTTWRWQAAALGTGALALVPVFMRWSIQVRTDQPAVAAGLWGGVMLLGSRSRPMLALGAGALVAVGYLFSQKALYVAALVGIVALGDLLQVGEFDWRREIKRAAWFVAGAIGVIAGFKLVLAMFYAPPRTVTLDEQLNAFANYRQLFGLRLYRSMLPTLYPHLAVLAAIVIATIDAYRRTRPQRRALLMALAIATLGVAVGAFHAAAFPYFWTTLGLFPATAMAIGWPGIAATLRSAAPPALVVVWGWVVWTAVPYRREVLRDTRSVQRLSFDLIDHLDPRLRGFSPDGGLFCRHDPDPFPIYFRETAVKMATAPDAEQRQSGFIAEFRRRPVAFILETFLLEPFPPRVRSFWATHYVRHTATVAVAGRRIEGSAGAELEFEVLVPGAYRWHGASPIVIGERQVLPGAAAELAVGTHPIRLEQATGAGLFVLDLATPPRPGPRAFHALAPILEIIGARRHW